MTPSNAWFLELTRVSPKRHLDWFRRFCYKQNPPNGVAKVKLTAQYRAITRFGNDMLGKIDNIQQHS